MLLDNPGMLLAVGLLAAGIFLIGLVFAVISAYIYIKKRPLRAAGLPAWAVALALALIFTLVLPGAIAFIVALIAFLEMGAMPPVVTCYAPVEDPINGTAMVAGALVTSRGKLLERLHASGKIPDSVYKKLKK